MTEWRKTTLGEVVELKRGYDLPATSRRPGDVPIVSSSGITGHHAVAKVQGPGVVTGRYGTLGQVFFIRSDFWPLNTALYVRDFKGNEPRFVAALLQSLELGRNDGAAAVPGINRNQLHGLPVTCPDTRTQRNIAAVLGSFYDLLGNIRRRVELLEQMAQTIYSEWFVHFRYPGYEDVVHVDSPLGLIPEGWAVRNLYEEADVGFGFSFKSNRFSRSGPYPVVRIRDVPYGTTKTFTDEYVAARYRVLDGDVLIGMDGDFHLRQWTGGDAWLNQRVARLRPLHDLSARHLLLSIEGPVRDWNAQISGTTVAHLGKRHLEQIQIVVPPSSVLAVANGFFAHAAKQECVLTQAARKLAIALDLLLPRLVTGQIDMSTLDLDAVVGAAM